MASNQEERVWFCSNCELEGSDIRTKEDRMEREHWCITHRMPLIKCERCNDGIKAELGIWKSRAEFFHNRLRALADEIIKEELKGDLSIEAEYILDKLVITEIDTDRETKDATTKG